MARREMSVSSKYGARMIENGLRQIMVDVPVELHTAMTSRASALDVTNREFVMRAVAHELNRTGDGSRDYTDLLPAPVARASVVSTLRSQNATLAAQIAEMQAQIAKLTANA